MSLQQIHACHKCHARQALSGHFETRFLADINAPLVSRTFGSRSVLWFFKANCFFRLTKKGNSCTLQELWNMQLPVVPQPGSICCALCLQDFPCSLRTLRFYFDARSYLTYLLSPSLQRDSTQLHAHFQYSRQLYLNCLPSPL
jgi:hypothetical protein